MFTKSDWLKCRPWIDEDDSDIEAYLSGATNILNKIALQESLSTWKEKGFVVFENVIDPATINILRSDVDYLRAHYKNYDLAAELRGEQRFLKDFSPEEIHLDGVKFNSIHTLSYAAIQLSLNKMITNFLYHIFGEPPAVLQSLTFCKGSQQPIHIDYPYVRCQSKIPFLAAAWIPLENVSHDSGPLSYFPGSHLISNSDFFDWGSGSVLMESDSDKTPSDFSLYLQQRMTELQIEPVIFCPKAGDVLIWHGNLAHGGTPIANQARTRYSYVTHYTSLSAYPAAHMKPNALNNGDYWTQNNGFVFEFPWLSKGARLPSFRAATKNG
jgi:ectoine hydroxylase-related dioxygenase (phytanoyl-CoA dioxygenase family)